MSRDIEELLKSKMVDEANKLAKEYNDNDNPVTYKEKDFEIQAKAIAAALNPVIDELLEVVSSVEAIHKSLPKAFSSIGAGTAAVGSAGGSAYRGATKSLSTKISKTKKDLKNLKS